MCSISGLVSLVVEQNPAEVVRRMNHALRHRGPDDSGIAQVKFDQTSICLGNTRLAIIDTSTAGHQPMSDPDTGNWITYNGETYNFQELRSEIGDEFGPWRSNTDTEVVIRAYRKWGVESFQRLRGMFACAIWDQQNGELVLARDRFGIKPLYFHVTPNRRIVFASEVRAILAGGLVEKRLSQSAVISFLQTGSVKAPLTIVDGVVSMLPGQYMTIDAKSLQLRLGSFVSQPTKTEATSREQAKSELREILEDSVKAHLVSDVPTGVFLSGGMDSSAIVALMSRVTSERPKTFSVVFNEQQFNESTHAREVATRFGTDHCEIKLDETALRSTLPEALLALDQPTMDGINTYVVSKAVKNAGVTVALSGLGGDELFGGYPSFRRALKLQKTSRIAKQALRGIAPVGRVLLNGSIPRSKFWQLAQSSGCASDVYRITRQLFPPSAVNLLSPAQTPVPQSGNGSVDADVVNEISRLELEGYMANTLLRDTDSMSMAHSLEVRVPFVDSEVAEYVLRLPGHWKLNWNDHSLPKPLLADVLSDLLPKEFLMRKKMGFTLPFQKWMTMDLKTEVDRVLASESALTQSGINAGEAQKLWRDFQQKPFSIGWSRPWSLYVLARWCELNGVTA